MPGMDVFDTNAFSMQELTAALLDEPHKPRQLGALGVFDSRGIFTTDVSIERKGKTLQLVQTTERGAPAVQNTRDIRDIVKVPTARIAVEDSITADEIQNVRQFGTEDQLAALEEEVQERDVRMSDSIDVTEEYQRIGAMKGQVLDADGSVLIDLQTTFGVGPQAEVGMNIAATLAGDLQKKINQAVIRPMEAALDGLSYTGVHVMTSSGFIDELAAHPDYREHMKGFPGGAQRHEERPSGPNRRIDFGGVVWEEYRGNVAGTSYVAADKAHAFPMGVRDLFLTRYAPAEYWDTVNTRGLPRYVRINPDGTDPDHKRTIRVQCQTLNICTRPGVLVPMRVGA